MALLVVSKLRNLCNAHRNSDPIKTKLTDKSIEKTRQLNHYHEPLKYSDLGDFVLVPLTLGRIYFL